MFSTLSKSKISVLNFVTVKYSLYLSSEAVLYARNNDSPLTCEQYYSCLFAYEPDFVEPIKTFSRVVQTSLVNFLH